MRMWIDDVRPMPEGYDYWCKSVNQAKIKIEAIENVRIFGSLSLIDIDHDAGDYASEGGDYIKLLDWFEETGRNYPIKIHSMNPVGVANMRAIIERNGWEEIK